MFTPIPKSAGLRSKPGVRPIGIEVPEGGWFAADVEIKQAVETKADKYGDLGQSLMVAVNYVGMHCDNIDVMNALYGQESTIVSFADDGGFTQRDQRKPNGLWFGQKGPRNPGVSGVMIASGLNPMNMGIVTPELFHNPWANHPLAPSTWQLPQCVADLEARRVEHLSGSQAGTVLGIPSPWPVPD